MTPTVGSIVHFFEPSRGDYQEGHIPWPAIITKVWSDHVVNLMVQPDVLGMSPYLVTSVGDAEGGSSRWAWPPREPWIAPQGLPAGTLAGVSIEPDATLVMEVNPNRDAPAETETENADQQPVAVSQD